MTQDGDTVAAKDGIIQRLKDTSESRLNPQGGKEVRRNRLTHDALTGVTISAELSQTESCRSDEFAEWARVLAELLEEHVGVAPLAIRVAARFALHQVEDLMRFFHRKRLPEGNVEKRENSRIGSNAEGERKHGGKREQKIGSQSVQGVAQVL